MRGIHLAVVSSGASLLSLPCALMQMRHEEATRSYEEVTANVDGGLDVLRVYGQRIRTKARP